MSADQPRPSRQVLRTQIAGELHGSLHTLQQSSCTSERRCPLLDLVWQVIEDAEKRGEQLRQNDQSKEVGA